MEELRMKKLKPKTAEHCIRLSDPVGDHYVRPEVLDVLASDEIDTELNITDGVVQPTNPNLVSRLYDDPGRIRIDSRHYQGKEVYLVGTWDSKEQSMLPGMLEDTTSYVEY